MTGKFGWDGTFKVIYLYIFLRRVGWSKGKVKLDQGQAQCRSNLRTPLSYPCGPVLDPWHEEDMICFYLAAVSIKISTILLYLDL